MIIRQIHTPTYFLTLLFLSFFIFSARYRTDRFECGLLRADIMSPTTQSELTLVALDLNINQRARLPSIEILVDT